MRVRHSRLVFVVLLGLLAGCAKDPLQVQTIQLGRSLNPDSSVAEHTTSFSRNDTIYVSVLTPASGAGTITARWTFGDRVIGEPSRQVSYQGPAATAFPLVNSGGFPPGSYTVEILIDGTSAGSRSFRVD